MTGAVPEVLSLAGSDGVDALLGLYDQAGVRDADGVVATIAAAIMAGDGSVSAADAVVSAAEMFPSLRLALRMRMPVEGLMRACPGDVVRAAGALHRMRSCGLPSSQWRGAMVSSPVRNPLMVVDPFAPVMGVDRVSGGSVDVMARTAGLAASGFTRLADAWGAVPSDGDWDEAGRVLLSAVDGLASGSVGAGAWACSLPGVPVSADPGVRRALLSVLFALSGVVGDGPYGADAIRSALSSVRCLQGMPDGFVSQELGMLRSRLLGVDGVGLDCRDVFMSMVAGAGLPVRGVVVGPAEGVSEGDWASIVSLMFAGRYGDAILPAAGSWFPSWSPVLYRMLGAGPDHGVGAVTRTTAAWAPDPCPAAGV